MKPSTERLQNLPPADSFSRFIAWACAFVVGVHLLGALLPNAFTWGFHHLGFFPLVAQLAFLALMAFSASARGRSLLYQLAQRLAQSGLSVKLPSLSAFVVLALCGALFWFLRERLYFLGDGFLVVRTLPNISELREVVIAYRNEPFVGWVVWKTYHLLTWLGVDSSAERTFQYLSIVFGLGTLALLPAFAKQLSPSKLDQLLLGLFIIGSGFIQLFFGYVELYAQTVFALLLFLLLSFRYLRGRTAFFFPSLAYAFLVSCHLGMLSVAPSYAYLVYLELRRGSVGKTAVAITGAVLLFVGLMMLSGYTPATFWNNLTGGEKIHLLSPMMTGNIWQPYTLFSVWHLIDFVNLIILISPFTLLLLPLAIGAFWRRERWSNAQWVFYLLTAICGAGFVFVANPDLGMSRDWDVLGLYLLPAVVFVAAMSAQWIQSHSVLRTTMVSVVAITLVHTIAWVGVNAGNERSLARFQTLQDERWWSTGALGNAFEELAIYFRNRQDYARAQEYFEKYLRLYPTNGRVWVSLANLLRLQNNIDGAIRAWEKALEHGQTKEDHYVELNRLYIQRERFEEGRKLTETALRQFPTSAKLYNNMGVIVARQANNIVSALPLFLQAIQNDSTVPESFLNAGLCYQQMKDQTNMKFYWEKFLQLAPDAPQAQQVRETLRKLK